MKTNKTEEGESEKAGSEGLAEGLASKPNSGQFRADLRP